MLDLACASPTMMPSRVVDPLERPVPAAHPVGGEQDETEQDQRPGDQPRIASALLDLVVEEPAEHPDRNRGDDDVPPHARVEVTAQLGAGRTARGARRRMRDDPG